MSSLLSFVQLLGMVNNAAFVEYRIHSCMHLHSCLCVFSMYISCFIKKKWFLFDKALYAFQVQQRRSVFRDWCFSVLFYNLTSHKRFVACLFRLVGVSIPSLDHTVIPFMCGCSFRLTFNLSLRDLCIFRISIIIIIKNINTISPSGINTQDTRAILLNRELLATERIQSIYNNLSILLKRIFYIITLLTLYTYGKSLCYFSIFRAYKIIITM